MTTYTFIEEFYWDDPGCSCCESTLMVFYNLVNEDDEIDWHHGTQHCIADCYRVCLDHEGVINLDEQPEYWDWEEHDLKSLCKDYDIEVEFIWNESVSLWKNEGH